MDSFYLCALLLICHTDLLAGILVKESSIKYSDGYSAQNSYVDIFSDAPSNQNKREPALKRVSVPKYSSNRTLLRRTPTEYNKKLIGDLRPIYESNIESDSVPTNDDHDGYHYTPPKLNKLQLHYDELENSRTPSASEELAAAIGTLNRYLKPILNSQSYNSALHPPLNPIISLVLSQYGKYIRGDSDSQLYSYMAVNNIHNNQPFGSYKHE